MGLDRLMECCCLDNGLVALSLGGLTGILIGVLRCLNHCLFFQTL